MGGLVKILFEGLHSKTTDMSFRLQKDLYVLVKVWNGFLHKISI